MNAAADSNLPAPPRAMATPHPTHKFRLLLRREFWEHKGGFLWAPLVAGAISLLLTIMAIVIGEVAARQALADGEFDGEVMINGLDLGYLTEKLGPEEMRNLSHAIDLALYMASGWPLIVLDTEMDTLGERFTEVMVNADSADAARALKPVDERTLPFGKTVMLFDNIPRDQLSGLGETRTPGLADLFVATMKGTYA